MKNLSKLILLIVISISIFSCNKDDSDEPQQGLDTEITGINPDIGPKNTTVTITGKDFGTDSSLVSVYFNGKETEILTLNDTEITAKVPVKSYTGLVTLKINDNDITGPKFTYTISVVEASFLAGNGLNGGSDGTGTGASFNYPIGITVDSNDNLFVVDTYNHRIRKITPAGVVTTFAGSIEGNVDGTGLSANFKFPYGIIADSNDNLYVTDSGNSTIRKITSAGVVTTIAGSTSGFADGIGTNAKFKSPTGIVISQDNILYIADQKNNKIRKIMPNGVVSTFSGSSQGYQDGSIASAKYYWPAAITIDGQGNLYVSDTYNHVIRKISTDGNVSTIAGSSAGFANGNSNDAKFNLPLGITIDAQNVLYIADYNNHKIRGINTDNSTVNTVAGSSSGYQEGTGSSARFKNPFGITIDSHGNIFIADTTNNRIRKITQE